MKRLFLGTFFFCLMFITTHAFAWSGKNVETGTDIEIEEGNLVRVGEDIEIYDYDNNEYKTVEVEDVTRYGDSVEIETYDYKTGETETFEMED
jgi:hypothetical protein